MFIHLGLKIYSFYGNKELYEISILKKNTKKKRVFCNAMYVLWTKNLNLPLNVNYWLIFTKECSLFRAELLAQNVVDVGKETFN